MRREVNEVFRTVGIVAIQHARGDIAESDAVLAQLIEKRDRIPLSNCRGLRSRNDAEQAFEWLERTYADATPASPI